MRLFRYSGRVKKSRVLVVDDEYDFREIASFLLNKLNYEVVTAIDGASALAAFKASPPDLVILDGHLPDIDGLEVCRRLKALPGGAETPVLLCTVRSSMENVSDALKAGAVDYLLKPFDADDFAARVARALEERRS